MLRARALPRYHTSTEEIASELAAEHCAWARARGFSPALVIAGLGGDPALDASWDDAHIFVERLWLNLDVWAEAA